MASSPDVLADNVRATRTAIDNDLEVLRVRLRDADPRKRIDMARWARTAMPVAAGISAMWMWGRLGSPVRSLDQLLLHDLSNLYATERVLVPALRALASRAADRELANGLEHHALETEGQIERLARVFRGLHVKPRKGSAAAIHAVLHDAQGLLKRRGNAGVRDAMIVETAQRIEHIEIANYGTARTFADTLGWTEVSQLLQQTLDEEKASDRRLTVLAERFVNPKSIRRR